MFEEPEVGEGSSVRAEVDWNGLGLGCFLYPTMMFDSAMETGKLQLTLSVLRTWLEGKKQLNNECQI